MFPALGKDPQCSLPMGFTTIVKHNKANTIMNLNIP
jgi:hypothetical protein